MVKGEDLSAWVGIVTLGSAGFAWILKSSQEYAIMKFKLERLEQSCNIQVSDIKDLGECLNELKEVILELKGQVHILKGYLPKREP